MAVRNAENGVVWGGYGALKVIKVMGNATSWWSAYDFLFDFNRNHASIFYRFRDIAGYLSKVADFDPPYAPVFGVPAVEYSNSGKKSIDSIRFDSR